MKKLYEQVFEYLRQVKTIKPKELEEKFNIKNSTLRRLLIKLEQQEKIKREFNSITINENNAINSHASQKILINVEAKKTIAKTAAVLANNYKNIFVGSGSNCYYLFDYLVNKNVDIYTNSIQNAYYALRKGFTHIHIIGGEIDNSTLASIPYDLNEIENLKFQIAFLGVDGIDSEGNLVAEGINEGVVKKYVAQQSNLIVALAEKQKINTKNFYNFTPAQKIIIVVSDYDGKWEHKNLHLINSTKRTTIQ